jgi:RsiW-degrading membrane proteinase PrsW (M82 family)
MPRPAVPVITPAITLALAIVPSWLLVRYFHDRDLYPEPPKVIWTTFAFGALITVPVLIVVFPAMILLPQAEGFVPFAVQYAFLYAAIPEEFFKLLVLLGYSLRRREFDEPMDGLVYGVVAALGFAALENALYSVAVGPVMTIVRGFTAVPAHACMGVIMGYYVGRARFEPKRRGALIVTGYVAATIVHGLYDTPLMVINAITTKYGELPEEYAPLAGTCMLLGIGVLVVSLLVARHLWRKTHQEQLEHPVPPALPCMPSGGAVPSLHAPHPASIASPPPIRTATLTRNPAQSIATSVLKLLAGIALSVFGGACLFASVRAFFDPDIDRSFFVNIAFAAVILGFIPLLVGLRSFRSGVRGLNVPRSVGGNSAQ